MARHLKTRIYLAVTALLILASVLSSFFNRKAAAKPTSQPLGMAAVQNPSAANVEEMRHDLEQPQVPLPNTAFPPGVPGANGVPYPIYGPGGMPPIATTPVQGSYSVQQPGMELERQKRELAYKAQFASNLAYSQKNTPDPGLTYAAAQAPAAVPAESQASPPPQPQQPRAQAQEGYTRPAEVNINSANGRPYVIWEGTYIETVLMNRLDGDASGPVKVMVTNPVYSHDHQHVLIPDGTVVLGESKKIGSSDFGHQRRIAVVFHRMIMPDGFSVDLDQFVGLNQIGDTGLKDKVNNHYLQIFGASIALGVIAGAAEISNSGGVLTGSGEDAYKYGVASQVSQSATTILDRFIQIPPTLTIREGHRVKVYILQDLLLPAVEHHTIPESF